jgi:hypothetical protein
MIMDNILGQNSHGNPGKNPNEECMALKPYWNLTGLNTSGKRFKVPLSFLT